MPDDVVYTSASTPEEIAAEAEARVLGESDAKVATELEGVSPGYFEDLDDTSISATVGPGALSQTLGRDAARAAAKQFPNDPEPISEAHAALLGTVGNLDAQAQALREAAAEFGNATSGGIGEYYGDLATGEVLAGAQIPNDRRIGPFHSPELARAALLEAVNHYRNRS